MRSGHNRAVDWWSLGALMYDMLTGAVCIHSNFCFTTRLKHFGWKHFYSLVSLVSALS